VRHRWAVVTVVVLTGLVVPLHAAEAACGWQVVPSPNISTRDHALLDVDAVSSTDVWAVGYYQQEIGQGPIQTLILHWDGVSWSVVPSPSPGTGNNILAGVTAVGPDDVWAVGRVQSDGPFKTLILHWDGEAWAQVPSPNVGTKANLLRDVDAVSGDDIWAVGDYFDRVTGRDRTLTMHWDGVSWTAVPSPNVQNEFGDEFNHLFSVSARTGSDAWSVGWAGSTGTVPIIMHWDGSAWGLSAAPDIDLLGLEDVSVIAADDVWAVGGDDQRGMSFHWDGISWTQIVGANDQSDLVGVSGLDARTVWAVGNEIHRWNGSRWRAVPGSDIGFGRQAVHAISRTDAWSVGATVQGNNTRTYTEHMTCTFS
jgi:hypothetical protein